MIVKIQPPNPGIRSAVAYNESKANGQEGVRPEGSEELQGIEDGHVVVTRNVPEDSTLLDEFARLEMLSLKKKKSGPRLKNLSFHMSINPSDTDRPLSEQEAVGLIDEIMTSLGYGTQPYRIYKHDDIRRPHYHVVSCRAGADGKKIEDSFERMKLRRTLRSLEDKYGFEIILNDAEKKREASKGEKKQKKTDKEGKQPSAPTQKQDAHEKKEPKKKTPVLPFSRKREEPVTQQITDAVNDALNWHFSTFEQLQNIMLRRYNVELGIQGPENNAYVVIQGTDGYGQPVTPIIKETELGLTLLKTIEGKIEKEKMHNRREQRERLEKLARAAMKASKSFDEFRKNMEQKGVWVVLSWKQDSDDIFGVTYLDRATKCAWKGSETAVNIKWLTETVKEKGWSFTRDKLQQKLDKKNERPSTPGTIMGKINLPLDMKKDLTPIRQTTHSATGKRGIPRLNVGHQQGSNATLGEDDILKKKKRDDDKEHVQYIGD